MMIRIATRASPLALHQAERAAAELAAVESGLETELLPLSTRGDELTDRALAPLGGKGLFIKALEQALEDGRARLAAHSLKDVPAELASGFALAAVMARDDPHDALVARGPGGLDALPRGARVGTASLRRRAQLLHARPDLDVLVLRGGVQTRLARLDAGDFDAVVLAAAGLARLGIERGEPIAPELMLPASGQGAIALEARADDADILALAARLDDPAARAAASAERAFCRTLGASCASPVAAYAAVREGRLRLRVRVLSADGARLLAGEREAAVEEAAKAGHELALELLARGAAALLDDDGEEA